MQKRKPESKAMMMVVVAVEEITKKTALTCFLYAVAFFYRCNHRRRCRSFRWLSNKILNMCVE